MEYELLIIAGDEVVTLQHRSIAGLLSLAVTKMGENTVAAAKMELGIAGGGTQIKDVSIYELQALADKGIACG